MFCQAWPGTETHREKQCEARSQSTKHKGRGMEIPGTETHREKQCDDETEKKQKRNSHTGSLLREPHLKHTLQLTFPAAAEASGVAVLHLACRSAEKAHRIAHLKVKWRSHGCRGGRWVGQNSRTSERMFCQAPCCGNHT